MRVIGMMSGTSVDGIDVAVADITELPPPSTFGAFPHRASPDSLLTIKQLAFMTVPWVEGTRAEIFSLIQKPTTAAALCRANFTVAHRFVDALLSVLEHVAIPLQTIDLIASHGQTIWHDVIDGQVTSTLQIGDPSVLAARTGITTVGNFRTADVAVGGQGAPLVSLYDWYFLRPKSAKFEVGDNGQTRSAHHWRAVQNIGGIGNVTFLPPQGTDGAAVAFDTGPGNLFIDWAAEQATGGEQKFDVDGRLAQAGSVSEPLLRTCLALPYFRQPPPKSTGRELFDHQLVAAWWTLAQQMGLAAVDFVATMTALTAITIADAYQQFAPDVIGEVIVAGGGAHNPVLLAAIRQELHQKLGRIVPVRTHADIGIDDKAKEALAFALMGYLAIHGKAGNVPSCTGAKNAQVLGQIAPGTNYRALLQQVY